MMITEEKVRLLVNTVYKLKFGFGCIIIRPVPVDMRWQLEIYILTDREKIIKQQSFIILPK